METVDFENTKGVAYIYSVSITGDDYFMANYLNFPKEIFAEKIS